MALECFKITRRHVIMIVDVRLEQRHDVWEDNLLSAKGKLKAVQHVYRLAKVFSGEGHYIHPRPVLREAKVLGVAKKGLPRIDAFLLPVGAFRQGHADHFVVPVKLKRLDDRAKRLASIMTQKVLDILEEDCLRSAPFHYLKDMEEYDTLLLVFKTRLQPRAAECLAREPCEQHIAADLGGLVLEFVCRQITFRIFVIQPFVCFPRSRIDLGRKHVLESPGHLESPSDASDSSAKVYGSVLQFLHRKSAASDSP